MAQRRGIHRILEIPIFYNFTQLVFSHRKTMSIWNELIEECRHGVVLDVDVVQAIEVTTLEIQKHI